MSEFLAVPLLNYLQCLHVVNQTAYWTVCASASSSSDCNGSASLLNVWLNAIVSDSAVAELVEVCCDNPQLKGKDVYIVQATNKPVNDMFMELVITTSACKRAGARTVTVAMPYYGYARQERKNANKQDPITAADVS